RIERRGGAAEITTVAGPLTEGVDVVDEWRSGGFVEAVEQIEAFGDDIQSQALAESNHARQPHVQRLEPVRDAHIAPQIAGRKDAVGNQRRATGRARHTKRAIGKDRWTISLV